jgi:broad specificity phosphatase PhoE
MPRFLFGVLLVLASLPLAAETPAVRAAPGQVVVLRHAHAPGVGDPPGFVPGDCATQRNLDARGRDQARQLGQHLRDAGYAGARVYTSEWCRCRETARLLALGPVEDLPLLNSFFAEPARRRAQTEAWRDFLARLPRHGAPVVFVTHQVNITALTGYFPASGEGLVLKLGPKGGFERLREWSSPQ